MTRSILHRAATLVALATLGACAEPTTAPLPVTPRRDLTVAEQRTIAASNHFAFDMLRTLGAGATVRGYNLVLSPYGGSASLGMALNGAAGSTLTGMQQALGIADVTVASSNATFHGLTSYLLGADAAVTVRTANSIWTANGFPIRPEFADALRTNFDADARTVAFGTSAATQAVNAWASDKTSGLIPKIFDAGQPDASTVALLVNALYFKGSWTQRFDAARTTPQPFTLADGSTASVPMMSAASAPVRTGALDGAQVGELAYGTGAYAMTIVLPARGTDLDAFAASLTDARWNALLATLHDAQLPVSLPKFTLQGETQWNDALIQLGMRDAFTPGVANFSALSPTCLPAGTADCHISLVKQNIYVRVDEEGTEAAAVTSTGIAITSVQAGFVVDRPFLFAVRERASGAILFIGRVVDPRGA